MFKIFHSENLNEKNDKIWQPFKSGFKGSGFKWTKERMGGEEG